MLAELEKKDFHKVESLFSERRFINKFRNHLERTPIAKKVFVDDKKNPQTDVILVLSTLFFGGRADNEEFNKKLRKFIYREFSQKFKEKRGKLINCYISNNDWEKGIGSVLKDPYYYNHYYYDIKEVRLKNWRVLIPEGYSIEPVDLTVMENDNLKNYDWLINEIEENWTPFEDGLREIGGFYLVRQSEEIVSWCTTEYLTNDNEIEVGIATREEYQRRNFASVVGSATAEYCLSKYKSVGWHCNTKNIGSYKTAEKIGYERINEYKMVAAPL